MYSTSIINCMCDFIGVLADHGSFSNMVGALPDDSNGLHARVRESRIAGKLGQALDSVLERGDGGGKVLFKDGRWR